MGDISTHAEIFAGNADLLRRGAQDDQVRFFELGNWLADTSQFRDPPAFYGAKIKVWEELAADTHPALLRLVGIDDYLDALWGTPERPGGAFAAWIKGFVEAICIETFRKRTRKETRRCVRSLRAKGTATWTDLDAAAKEKLIEHARGERAQPGKKQRDPERLPAEEVYRVFNRHWTQYYPHEHLDLPPLAPGAARPRLERSRHLAWPQGRRPGVPQPWRPRRIAAYLEDHLAYVAERLRAVEALAARAQAGRMPIEDRRLYGTERAWRRALYAEALVVLGRASHAVEDFFFHSNYAEIVALHRHARAYAKASPQAAPLSEEAAYRQARFWSYVGKAEGWGTDVQRRLYRRLLTYPGERAALSEGRTAAGPSPIVYTGGFGANDVYHTLYNGLEGMEESYRETLQPLLSKKGETEPLDYIFVEARRRELVDASVRNRVLRTYWRRVDGRYYENRLDRLAFDGCIHFLSRAALLQTFRIDRQLRAGYAFAEESESGGLRASWASTTTNPSAWRGSCFSW